MAAAVSSTSPGKRAWAEVALGESSIAAIEGDPSSETAHLQGALPGEADGSFVCGIRDLQVPSGAMAFQPVTFANFDIA